MPVLINCKIESFAEISDLARDWDVDFRQVSAGSGNNFLFQAAIGQMMHSNAYFDCTVRQSGSTPEGMRTFAILNANSPPVSVFGKLVERSEFLMVFPTTNELHSVSRPGFNTWTFSLPIPLLKRHFRLKGNSGYHRILPASEAALPMHRPQLKRFRALLQLAENIARTTSSFPPYLEASIQDELIDLIHEVASAQLPQEAPVGVSGARTLDRALDYIEANLQRPLRVSELCAVSGTTERTLFNKFRENLGVSPSSYLKAQRLFGVHRSLWSSDPSTVRIADIANQWGFWHMGQLAADYRKLFQELPSETLSQQH